MRIRTIIKAQKARTITARLAFILALFLVLYGAAGYWVTWAAETYDKYVQSRNQTFIVHDSSSKKLFNINKNRIYMIKMYNKLCPDTESTGAKVRYKRYPGLADLVSDNYIDEVADLLNSFEFTFVLGGFDYLFGPLPPSASITLYYDLETRENFWKNPKFVELYYTPDYIVFGDFAYYGDEEFFKKLYAIGEKYVEYSPGDLAPVY